MITVDKRWDETDEDFAARQLWESFHDSPIKTVSIHNIF